MMGFAVRAAVLALVSVLVSVPAAFGQSCEWDNGIGQPGLSGGALPAVNALAVYNDGGGPALFVGGSFSQAGGTSANNIAKWNGTSWSALSLGTDMSVNDMIAFNDGSGTKLYVAGAFTQAGPIAASYIARWDGSNWATVGPGFNSVVYDLEVYDDGSGPKLYAAGAFMVAGGQLVNHIAEWNGSAWDKLLTGTDQPVNAMTVWNDGSGRSLYAAGEFQNASSTSANRAVEWNGSQWLAMTSGLNNDGLALAAIEGTSSIGPALYAGGNFTSAGTIPMMNIAKWNGSIWGVVGSGLTSRVLALEIFNEGTGPALYAGGAISSSGGTPLSNIAKWNGVTWSGVGTGTDDDVRVLLATNETNFVGRALYAGGTFTSAGGQNANRIARWICDFEPTDCDTDGDYDLDDYNQIENCLSGPTVPAGGGCDCADLDGDNNVDLRDVSLFFGLFVLP